MRTCFVKRFIQFVLLLVVTAFVFAPSAYATSNHNPGGNNGFVKINNELAPDDIPNNHPHVSCTFSVEFYNYDKGDYKADVNFSLQQPTAGAGYSLTVASGNLKPFIGGDNAGGGNDLDASEVYKLTFTGKEHAQQGYHVKLVVNAPGSKGSDKKQKVFWVKPCATTTTTTNPTNNPQVLGTSTPHILPVTGVPTSLVVLGSSLVGFAGYLGHYFVKRRSV